VLLLQTGSGLAVDLRIGPEVIHHLTSEPDDPVGGR
jgi:hypothetical protein